MSEKNSKQIKFGLRGITTEQFAVLENAYKEGVEVRLLNNLRFAKNDETKMVGTYIRIEFMQNETPFIIIDMGLHIQIEDKSWDENYNNETKELTLPKVFASHLAGLAIGVTRGYLHSKTEKNPIISKFFIPLLDATMVINEDVKLTSV